MRRRLAPLPLLVPAPVVVLAAGGAQLMAAAVKPGSVSSAQAAQIVAYLKTLR